MHLHRPLDGYPVLARAGAIVPLTRDGLGVGNPDALELHVFAGADGDFTLYEDDDAAEPRAVTTRYRYDQAAGELVIEPASGALDLVPEVRAYRVVVHGLDGVGAAAADGTVAGGGDRCRPTGGRAVRCHGRGGDRAAHRVSGARPTTAWSRGIFDLLATAQIEYPLKDSIWRMLQDETDTVRRVAALQVMELEPALHAALSELLLA